MQCAQRLRAQIGSIDRLAELCILGSETVILLDQLPILTFCLGHLLGQSVDFVVGFVNLLLQSNHLAVVRLKLNQLGIGRIQ